jgi:hypothetical protein
MTNIRPKKATGALALVALLACSACGSSGPPPLTLRQQAQNIFTNTDAALTADRAAAKTTSLIYAKWGVDFGRAAAQFRALPFPASMHKDAKTLEADLEIMAADAKKLGVAQSKSQKVLKNVQAEGEDTLKLTEAEETERKASNAVRRDVGLPIEVTTTTTTPGLSPTPLSPSTTAPSATTTTTG